MAGPNTGGGAPVFGTQGVPSVNNRPPGTYGPICWTDNTGLFWLYGGNSNYADMWRFNPTTLEWTWVKGTGVANVASVYGTQGIPALTNTPGSRSFNGCTWVDQNNDLWLYGGIVNGGGGDASDLWRYNIATNMWTFMSGYTTTNHLPVYGTQGVPAITNQPGSRREIGNSWVDATGKFWLYGGLYTSGTVVYNNLWNYDPSTNMWTWVWGSQTNNLAPVYGTQGVFSAATSPGGKFPYAMWMDNAGKMFMFGGGGQNVSASSDFWQYDPVTNEWAWMIGGGAGIAGNQCQSDATFYPNSRYENRAAWKDAQDNFWMYGGYSIYGDMWVYLHDCNQWARMSPGALQNTAPVFGTQGVPAVTNQPGSRYGMGHWQDINGDFWIFGGTVTSLSTPNDMWMYHPDLSCVTSSCNPPMASFIADTVFCPNYCDSFINTSSANCTNWVWSFPGGVPSSFVGQNPPLVCYNTVGDFTAQLIAGNAFGSDTFTQVIHVVPCTAPNAFFSVSDTTVCRTDCVTFTDLSTGFPTTWSWTFPGGNPHTYNGQQPPLICFDTIGGVLVHLVVSNIYGTDSVDLKVTVIDCSPHAHFYASDTTICHDDCIIYTNTSSANCTAWTWNFPGGVPSSFVGQNPPSVCYATVGNYLTTLIVSNAYGIDTTYQTIHVLPCIHPAAFFSISDTDICKTDCITFTNSSAFATSYSWYFPGGGPSSSTNQNPPPVCYPTVGNYIVQLIATNAYGSDTNIQHVHVHDCTPQAAFAISDTSICIDSCVNFANFSSANATSWQWTFDGGSPASFNGASPPSVCYHTAGIFIVKLVVSNQYGTDSITHIIVVHLGPSPFVTPPSSEIHIGESVQLNASGGLVYSWTPATGLNDATINNPVASPNVTTTYYVIMSDMDGCASRDSAMVFIIPTMFIPDAFSPNGDGSNDVFRMINPQDVMELDIKIFNRWGQLVFHSNTPYFEWDGTFKSAMQEVDVYVWEINVLPLNSSTTILMKGNVSLIR